MAKTKFTFRNYLGELKKSWLLLAVFFVLGGILGGVYSFTRPTMYEAEAKLSIYNSHVDNGSATSPYSQIIELLSSAKLLANVDGSIDAASAPNFSVKESPRGIFEITVTDKDAEVAKDFANKILINSNNVIAAAFDDAYNYRVTIIEEALEANPTVTTKSRIITAAIIALGMLVLAAVVIFIRFDYNSEK